MDTQAHDHPVSFSTEEIDYNIEHSAAVSSWLITTAAERDKEISLLEYVLCSDEYILKVNKEHLDHDYYTDIITFPLQESPLEATIFISVDRVKENAELYNCSEQDELHRVMVHGLLHLLGYNDKTTDEKKQMRLEEDNCLSERNFV